MCRSLSAPVERCMLTTLPLACLRLGLSTSGALCSVRGPPFTGVWLSAVRLVTRPLIRKVLVFLRVCLLCLWVCLICPAFVAYLYLIIRLFIPLVTATALVNVVVYPGKNNRPIDQKSAR